MHQIIDISSNNTHPINWSQLKAEGIDAVMIKATEGNWYTNPFFAGDRNDATKAGILVAAYHYARFGDYGQEAAFFLKVAGVDAKILDVETSQDVGWINGFLSALGKPLNQEMTYGSASTLPGGAIRGLIWSAAWGSVAPNAGEALWQYTDNWNGYDRSEWLGSEQQYASFFGATPAPKPTPVPPPPPRPAPPARRNVFTPVAVDGQFGPQTCKAMQFVVFNGNSGLCDGIFGPVTKQYLQRHLGVPADGIIGRQTIIALQQRVSAAADGVWGSQTTSDLQRALNSGTF